MKSENRLERHCRRFCFSAGCSAAGPADPPPPRSVAAWQCVGTATALSSMPGLRPSGWLRGTFWARVPENSDVSAAHSNEQAEGSTTLAVLGRGEEEGGEGEDSGLEC